MTQTTEHPIELLEQGFRLGPWRVLPHANLLECGEAEGAKRVRVSCKAMQVLVLLAGHAGRFVSKDELLGTVWAGRVVTEDVITGAVHTLRRALQEDAHAPRLIETRKGYGYRVIADVRVEDRARKRRSLWPAAGVVAVILVVALLAAALLLRPPPAAPPTVAVLPFVNLSDDERGIYVASAITDALILDLAERDRFRVISRTSVLPYAGQSKPLPRIASELGADYLVEGSVLLSAQDLRISAQLIDARDDTHRWASRFDRRFDDLLAIQTEVANHITRHIVGVVTERPIPRSRPLPPDAHERLLQARFLLAQEEHGAAQRALSLFTELAQAHPAVADGHLGQAQARLYLFKEYLVPPETLRQAYEEVSRAIELDPDRAEAYACLGQIVFFKDWDFARSESAYRRAIELNPSDTVARRRYAWLLVSLQRYAAALGQIEEIRLLDPHYYASADGALLLMFSGRIAEAVSELERLVATTPDSAQTLRILSVAYWGVGRYDDSAEALIKSRTAKGSPPHEQRALRDAFASDGRAGVYRYLLQTGAFRSPVAIAALYAQLGDREAAFDWLDRAVSAHDPGVLFLDSRPEFLALQDDSRFQDLVQRVRPRL